MTASCVADQLPLSPPRSHGPVSRSAHDAVLTCSEEELWIATARRETQRARLTRYVETVTKTVEVRHEQVRVEYEPVLAVDELDRPATGPQQATKAGSSSATKRRS